MTNNRSEPTRLDILDTFVVTTVATIIVIRAFLVVMGFPRLGDDFFHIAHVLWGGLLLGMALLLSLLTPINRLVIAFLGGAGFGFFIDEVGKFVTSDNNYFYQGTFFLIYVTVLSIWLIARAAISRAERRPLFVEAAWPEKALETKLLISWAIVQCGLLPLVAVRIAPNGYSLIETVQLVFLAIFTILLVAGLLLAYLDRRDASASWVRLATFILILMILPFLYYLSPEFAIAETIAAIMVVIGLSEVSTSRLLRYLWPFR